jgi:hypothetical protein
MEERCEFCKPMHRMHLLILRNFDRVMPRGHTRGSIKLEGRNLKVGEHLGGETMQRKA